MPWKGATSVPVAVETLEVFGLEAHLFLKDLDHRIREVTLEPQSYHFLQQRLAVVVHDQRRNAAAIQLGTSGGLNSGSDPFLPVL